MEPGPVVDRFDHVRSTLLEMEQFTRSKVDLQFPVVSASYFDDAVIRADVQPVDILPAGNFGLGCSSCNSQYLRERYFRRLVADTALMRGRLYPGKLFFDLQEESAD